MTLGGCATTVVLGGTSKLTAAPAPIRAPLPMRMSPTSTAFAPIRQLSPLRERTGSRLLADVMTFVLNRMAHKRGGYIGRGADIADIPSLPHGLHGIYISRYASIGRGCRIYQNVTIGEVNGPPSAPAVERAASKATDGCPRSSP